MLQGTLDVFSLDEVLGLLSSASKTGVLNITGDRGVGTIAIADGHLVAGSASCAPAAEELSEVVFELLRFEEGSFSFDGDAAASGEPAELETVLTAAHARLAEWREIEAVVPTLDHRLALADSLSTSQVTLNESEWAAIVAIGEGATVGVVATRLDLGEFDGSKRVKGLVERSLATIAAATTTPAHVPVDDTAVDDTADAAHSFESPLFETPAPAPATLEVPSFDTPSIEEPSATVVPDPVDVPVDAHVVETIPPMPEAPETAPAALDELAADDDIPPMPEPPAHIPDEAAIAGEFAAPIESEQVTTLSAVDGDAPSSFGGLDPIGSVDMFEPPHRVADGPTDGFMIADANPPVADAEPTPPPISSETVGDIPSPAASVFDSAPFTEDDDPTAFVTDNADDGADVAADPFAGSEPTDPSVGDAVASDEGDDDTTPDKGGSLLMRYLKSHG